MKTITKIKEHIVSYIIKEQSKVNTEIEELRIKQRSNMSDYGLGGPFQRYEKAIERRKDQLAELDALKKSLHSAVILVPMRFYGYCCPSCAEKVYIQSRNPETVECPLCGRRIYRDGAYTEWMIQKNSRFTKLNH